VNIGVERVSKSDVLLFDQHLFRKDKVNMETGRKTRTGPALECHLVVCSKLFQEVCDGIFRKYESNPLFIYGSYVLREEINFAWLLGRHSKHFGK